MNSMKYLVLICLGLCACARPQTNVAKHVGGSVEQCDKLYAHNLVMSLEADKDSSYYREHLQESLVELDAEYQSQGLTSKFYSYCLDRMIPEQIECALLAQTLTTENLCQ